MKRAIILAVLFAAAVGISLPLLSSEASRLKERRAASSRKKIKKHSRAWWRRYYARVKKKRALRARKKAIAAWRRKAASKAAQTARVVPSVKPTRSAKQVRSNHPPILPQPAFEPPSDNKGGLFADPGGDYSVSLPEGWSSRPVVINGERKFMVFGPNGEPIGQASLSSAWAREANDNGGAGRNRSLGGIPLRDLRRTVIDKMANSNGWVVSDGEQEINGRRVFVVNAQTGTIDGKPQQAWTYYFTEADGRIYSMTTSAPMENSEKLSNDSSKVLSTLRSNSATRAESKSEPPKKTQEQQ
jgi:hypothetical protein